MALNPNLQSILAIVIGVALLATTVPKQALPASGSEQARRNERDDPLIVGLVRTPARLRPHSKRRSRGCIYARYSTRFQHSIEDQVRACLAWAAANGVAVDEMRHVFIDRAKTGRTHKRSGLQALLAALEADEVDVVIAFGTSRVYRKCYQSLKFAEEEIVSRRKRMVFVSQGIDTADADQWRHVFNLYAMMDEMQATSLAAFVRNAHEGLLDRELIHGTISFGYRGDPVPGETTRRGKPKCKWAVNDVAAEWVKCVFRWFVHDGFTAAAIARMLNRKGAPLPPRCQTGGWTDEAVKLLLRNRRYIGDFAYGRKEAVWQAKQGYSRQFTRDKPLKEKRMDRLRLIDDATFEAAEERLSKYKGRGGRRPAGGEKLPPHLLRGLLWCPRHQRFLCTFGRGWACGQCKQELRDADTGSAALPADVLYSQVNPELAVRLLCKKVADAIGRDDAFMEMVCESFAEVAKRLQAPDPAAAQALKREHQSWTLKLNAMYEAPAENEEDRAEQRQRISDFQRRRADVSRQLERLEKSAQLRVETPTPDAVRRQAAALRRTLLDAAGSSDPEVLSKVRAIIESITGGRIEITQQGERAAKRGWLRGSFALHLVNAFGVTGALPVDANRAQLGPVVEIDFREQTTAESLATEVMRRVESGMLLVQIERELGVSRNRVSEAYKHACRARGVEPADGRSRRSTLITQHTVPPKYQAIVDDVVKLERAGLMLHDIADQLDVDRNTVTASLRYWHARQGQPAPDGRARRKRLSVKSRPYKPRVASAAVPE